MTAELFMTEDEVQRITGRCRPSWQRKWLKDHGWTFEVDAGGYPIVLRSYAEFRLGGTDKNNAAKPRWDRLNGKVA